MICNELYNGQGLGNQLWNYALLRIVTKKNNTSFSVLAKDKFKGKDFLTIDFGEKTKGGLSPEGGPAFTLPENIYSYYKEKKEVFLDTKIDVSRTDSNLLEIPDGTKFDGNCQSTKYLTGQRENLLKWITLKDEYKKYALEEHACVIHMRCGDFKNITDVFLPAEYYKNAMEKIQNIDPSVVFYCVTDEKDVAEKMLPGIKVVGSSLLKNEDPNKANHHMGGPAGIDFSILLHAKYLIIPNSSFSWWAAYLNVNKKIVIAPKYWAAYNVSNGYWSTSDIITDEFTYLDKKNCLYSANECWSEKEIFEKSHQDFFKESEEENKLQINFFSFIFKKVKHILYQYKKYIKK